MERIIQLHIEKLPEGVYLATSDNVQGLVAQGRTIQEAIEIARDVAKKLTQSPRRTTRRNAARHSIYCDLLGSDTNKSTDTCHREAAGRGDPS